MKFRIDRKIIEKFPLLNVGLVIGKGLDNSGESSEVTGMLGRITEFVRNNHSLASLEEEPKFIAWRDAFRAFGAKPKKYKCSVENLYRMILEGVDLRHINKIVDIYNYVSLKYALPVGGDDIDKVDGDIALMLANGEEDFVRLNSGEVDHPKAGEVVYSDDKEILCRRWNWRECDKSKMTPRTRNVAIVVEGLPPATEEVRQATEELAELLEKFCGGTVKNAVLNADVPEAEIVP